MTPVEVEALRAQVREEANATFGSASLECRAGNREAAQVLFAAASRLAQLAECPAGVLVFFLDEVLEEDPGSRSAT